MRGEAGWEGRPGGLAPFLEAALPGGREQEAVLVHQTEWAAPPLQPRALRPRG